MMYFTSRCLYNSCHNHNLLCQKKNKKNKNDTDLLQLFNLLLPNDGVVDGQHLHALLLLQTVLVHADNDL